MEVTERKLMTMGLPPGFRFHPTDEELVVQYLRRKALSFPLPASVIPELDLATYDPWDLPGGGVEGERYFFNRREAAHAKGKRSSTQPTKSGYWKATGKDRPVMATSKHGIRQLAGMKKVLVFHHGSKSKSARGSKTHWVMHEYRLANLETMASSISSDNRKMATQLLQGKNWVVCRIFTKKKRARNDPHTSLEASCVTDALDQECSKGEEASSKFVAPSP